MLFVQFAYAGMFLICKEAFNAGMNPYVFVAYRQAFATASLAPFAFFLDRYKTYIYIYKFYISIALFKLVFSLD